jgi:hypothetical protein
MPTKIQIRRGTASQWTSANPTLASGEFGLETDTDKVKLGDGETAWTSLAYFQPISFDGLSDVTLTSPVNGSFVKYNSETSSWEDSVVIDGGIASSIYPPVGGGGGGGGGGSDSRLKDDIQYLGDSWTTN